MSFYGVLYYFYSDMIEEEEVYIYKKDQIEQIKQKIEENFFNNMTQLIENKEKEKMPELEIIDLDETLYCTKERRRELFEITLYNLAAETNVANDDRVNYSSLLDYFMEAKKEGYYNLEDFKEQYISMTTIQGKNNKMIKTK